MTTYVYLIVGSTGTVQAVASSLAGADTMRRALGLDALTYHVEQWPLDNLMLRPRFKRWAFPLIAVPGVPSSGEGSQA